MAGPEFYVGTYARIIDRQHRLQLPSEFQMETGSSLYIAKASRELLCYDSTRFREMAKNFSTHQFKEYHKLRVESSHRICLNGEYNLPKKVIVEGRGDHFSVRGVPSRLTRILGFIGGSRK